MLKTSQAAELTGSDYPSSGRQGFQIETEQFVVIKLVIVAVLQSTISVNTGFVGEGIFPYSRLVDGYRNAKSVRDVLGQLGRDFEVYGVANLVVLHFSGKIDGKNAAQQVGLPGPLTEPIDRGINVGVDPSIDCPFSSSNGVSHCHA